MDKTKVARRTPPTTDPKRDAERDATLLLFSEAYGLAGTVEMLHDLSSYLRTIEDQEDENDRDTRLPVVKDALIEKIDDLAENAVRQVGKLVHALKPAHVAVTA